MKNMLKALLPLLILVSVTGCQEMFRADPPKTSGTFLPHRERLIGKPADFPFHYFWLADSVQSQNYQNICVLPVNTAHVIKKAAVTDKEKKAFAQLEKEIVSLSSVMQNAYKIELRKNQSKTGLSVIETPETPHTLVMELAICEITPTQSEMAIFGTVADFLLIPGISIITSNVASGSLVVECKVTDAQTGNLIMMYADREEDPAALLNTAQFKPFESTRVNIQSLAEQTAKIFSSEQLKTLTRPFPLSIVK